jgi:hypothetical protein
MSSSMPDAGRERVLPDAERGGRRDAVIVLPAASPYEWQLLAEHVSAAARQRGSVRLRVGGVDCVVDRDGARGRRCSTCARPLRITFRLAGLELCLACACARLAGDTGDAARRGVVVLG